MSADDPKASPKPPIAVFLDDGGALNDNALRRPEWLRLIGDFMPSRLGGTPEQWAHANAAVIPDVMSRYTQRLPAGTGYQDFHRAYCLDWMGTMCERLGIAALPDDDAVRLHRELSVYVSERAECAIPGAVEAVLRLRGAGFTLFTASGTPSWELRGILGRMGIGGAFTRLYGPDLIDRVKHRPAFYEGIFAHSGVAPADALVIDSDEECCRWAIEAGATAIWIDASNRADAPSLAAYVETLL